MACNECGEKPKHICNDFTKAVIEIDNPETLVLLRKVVIPASLGDDTSVPPVIGKYRNVVLQYEANKHIYLYSSDGIPTLLETEVPQEVLDRITTLEDTTSTLRDDLTTETEARQREDGILQQEINDLKNNPDVVDVVATHADLMAYDTSTLTDRDIIRVLEDEMHSGQSTYYRWDASSESWTYVGEAGDYYTREQVDTLLDTKQDELTAGENITIEDESGALVISATDTTYTAGNGLNLNGTEFSVDTATIATQQDLAEGLAEKQDELTPGDNISIEDESGALTISAVDTTYTAGTGLNLNGTEFSADTTTLATQTDLSNGLATKQDTLTSGDNITIEDESGALVISAQDTTYSAGYGLELNGTTFSVDPTVIQDTLTAGENISIEDESGDLVISATDTTYTAGNGLVLSSGQFSVNTSIVATQNDLTSGLATKQNTITSNNKLSADLVDDTNTTNKFVTATDKNNWDSKQDELTAGDNITIEDESGALVISADDTTYSNFVGTDGTTAGVAGLVPAPATTDAGKVLGANGNWVTGGPTVVQSRGDSTTDVMSQSATTSLIYSDIRPYHYGSLIRIGYGASNTSNVSSEGIAIGASSKTTGNYGITLGTYAWVEANSGIAIGGASGTGQAPRVRASHSIAIGDHVDVEYSAPYSVVIGAGDGASGRSITAQGSVSLGAFSKATSVGEMNIGLSEATAAQQATYGYNGSEYRLLSGLYDPQTAHDAATKGYVDTVLAGKQDELTAGDGITIADESGALVISADRTQPYSYGNMITFTTANDSNEHDLQSYTVTEAGVYQIFCDGWIYENWATLTANIYPCVKIKKNGTEVCKTQEQISNDSDMTEQRDMDVQCLLPLSAGDVITIVFQQNNSSAADMKFEYSWGIVKVSD